MAVQWKEGQDLKFSAESHLKLESINKALREEEPPHSHAPRASGSWGQHVATEIIIQAHFRMFKRLFHYFNSSI